MASVIPYSAAFLPYIVSWPGCPLGTWSGARRSIHSLFRLNYVFYDAEVFQLNQHIIVKLLSKHNVMISIMLSHSPEGEEQYVSTLSQRWRVENYASVSRFLR